MTPEHSVGTRANSRPAWHFTPARNWMNDPNGLVFARGRYHLFFQHNPEGNHWANMSWGHATSPDLCAWTEHEVALAHSEVEDVYSGCVVVDESNSSGFGDDASPPLVAVYTSAFATGIQAISLAWSLDDGMTWTRFKGNPVLDRQSKNFRDPKVFPWTDETGAVRWILVAVEAVERLVLIYSSENLREWTFESSLGGFGPDDVVWECPDLFPLGPRDEGGIQPWVLLLSTNPTHVYADPRGSSMGYLVGEFDGHRFVLSDRSPWRPVDHGRDFYAAVSFENAPAGRRVVMGWMSNWAYADLVPTEPFRGAMSAPRELSLRRSDDGAAELVQTPITAESVSPARITWLARDSDGVIAELRDRDAVVARVTYEVESQKLAFERIAPQGLELPVAYEGVSVAHVPLKDGHLELDVYLDSFLVEIFADGGVVAMSHQVFAGNGDLRLVVAPAR
jgi:fructan beta-fructosidase